MDTSRPTLDALRAYDEVFARITGNLSELAERTGLRLVLLIDRQGFTLARHVTDGQSVSVESMDKVATLVAANNSAALALAEELGEPAFLEQVYQGSKGTLYIESLGEEAMLTMVFALGVPVGKVKVQAKRTAHLVQEELVRMAALPKPSLGADFQDGANDMLDSLLGF